MKAIATIIGGVSMIAAFFFFLMFFIVNREIDILFYFLISLALNIVSSKYHNWLTSLEKKHSPPAIKTSDKEEETMEQVILKEIQSITERERAWKKEYNRITTEMIGISRSHLDEQEKEIQLKPYRIQLTELQKLYEEMKSEEQLNRLKERLEQAVHDEVLKDIAKKL